jgi:hypothetical protein
LASFRLSHRVFQTCSFAEASPKPKNARCAPLHLFCQCSRRRISRFTDPIIQISINPKIQPFIAIAPQSLTNLSDHIPPVPPKIILQPLDTVSPAFGKRHSAFRTPCSWQTGPVPCAKSPAICRSPVVYGWKNSSTYRPHPRRRAAQNLSPQALSKTTPPEKIDRCFQS